MKVTTFLKKSFVDAFYAAEDGNDEAFKKQLEEGIHTTALFIIGDSRIDEGDKLSIGQDKLIPITIDIDINDINESN